MTTEKVKRKLTGILSADMKGYSRLMGADEVETIRILQTYRGVISDVIQKKGGRLKPLTVDAGLLKSAFCGLDY